MNIPTRSVFDFSHVTSINNAPPAAKPKEPIYIEVILHTDIKASVSDNKRMQKNFDVARTEIENATGRKVEITVNKDPFMRDFEYKKPDSAHDVLEKKVAQMLASDSKNLPTEKSSRLHKYLFVTPKGVNGHIGIGAADMKTGIASLKDDRGIAHAIGHMFGATHDDGEVNYDGWWNDTLMNVDAGSPLRGNDFRYSDKNRENIRNHLNKFA
ncbi:hypothetical protein [Pseudomonas sp. MWU16-30323]|jgi:hypothetical protein|uniref:hypothetical protein n=1 Tax=Pseudomonas sp. MWU16-30323 TaxID=2878094 RepID=UPI001CFB7189|nr:hypothetical protein [Pseudomonas sp. MWU16-30323]